MNDIERLQDNILNQAKIFLLELGEFAPFGSSIDDNCIVKPLSAYIDDEVISPVKIIDLLEKHINVMLSSGDYIAAAIAINVTLKKNNQEFDGIEIRIFEKQRQHKKHFQWEIEKGNISFREMAI